MLSYTFKKTPLKPQCPSSQGGEIESFYQAKFATLAHRSRKYTHNIYITHHVQHRGLKRFYRISVSGFG